MADLDANDLLLFARVAEAGSFSRAANKMRLPKSTVFAGIGPAPDAAVLPVTV